MLTHDQLEAARKLFADDAPYSIIEQFSLAMATLQSSEKASTAFAREAACLALDHVREIAPLRPETTHARGQAS